MSNQKIYWPPHGPHFGFFFDIFITKMDEYIEPLNNERIAVAFAKQLGKEVMAKDTQNACADHLRDLGKAMYDKDPVVYLRMYESVNAAIQSIVFKLQNNWKLSNRKLDFDLARDTVALSLLVGCYIPGVDEFKSIMACLQNAFPGKVRELRQQWRNWVSDFWPPFLVKNISPPFVRVNSDPIHVKSIHELYPFEKELGSGVSGIVYLARSVLTPERRVAVKQIVANVDLDTVIQEVKLLNELQAAYYAETKSNCPDFMACYLGLYYDSSDENIYIVMEYAPGMTFDKYMETVYFKATDSDNHNVQTEFREILRQILVALDWFGEHQFLYLDVHGGNIMIDHDDLKKSPHVKFVDYGSLCSLQKSKDNPVPCGAEHPMIIHWSPEMDRDLTKFKQSVYVHKKAQNWIKSPVYSLGKILNNYRKQYGMQDKCVKTMIKSMLLKDEEQRPSAKMLLQYLDKCPPPK
jgi:hypothetical protein